MAPIIAAAAIPAAISAISSIGGMVASAKQNQENVNSQNAANAANLQFQRENLDYQKALQQQIFQREDTAWQRATADAKAAGLSPLAVSSPSATGNVVSTTAQQSQATTSDLSGVAQGMYQIGAAAQQYATMALQNRQLQENIRATNIKNTQELLKLENDRAKWQSDLRFRSNSFAESHKEQIREFDANLAHLMAQDARSAYESDRDYKLRFGEQLFQHDYLSKNADWEHHFRQSEADRQFSELQKNNDANRRMTNAQAWQIEYDNKQLEKYGYKSGANQWQVLSGGAAKVGDYVDAGLRALLNLVIH